MKTPSIVKVVIASILIAAGMIWSIMFPKTREILRPDFVASVAVGIGLVVPGVLILFLKRARVLPIVLSILLLWSLLMNVFFVCWVRQFVEVFHEEVRSNSISQTDSRTP